MARPALPKNIHILKGTAKVNPERMRERENEPENTNPIGKPYDHLTNPEKVAWRQIVKIAIEGVLGEADRLLVEQAAVLLAHCRGNTIEDGKVIKATAAERTLYTKLLGQMGMSPSERSKISINPKNNKNPFDD
ncbi:MAG: hypothetical protein GY941_18575 [Planctomycetes bacterium]|nr:hypothetical protein [Planctomycetota bacterium]